MSAVHKRYLTFYYADYQEISVFQIPKCFLILMAQLLGHMIMMWVMAYDASIVLHVFKQAG